MMLRCSRVRTARHNEFLNIKMTQNKNSCSEQYNLIYRPALKASLGVSPTIKFHNSRAEMYDYLNKLDEKCKHLLKKPYLDDLTQQALGGYYFNPGRRDYSCALPVRGLSEKWNYHIYTTEDSLPHEVSHVAIWDFITGNSNEHLLQHYRSYAAFHEGVAEALCNSLLKIDGKNLTPFRANQFQEYVNLSKRFITQFVQSGKASKGLEIIAGLILIASAENPPKTFQIVRDLLENEVYDDSTVSKHIFANYISSNPLSKTENL